MKFNEFIEEIPQELLEEAANKGKVERIDYVTKHLNGSDMNKYAFVYTPYGYDETKEYEILYLIHGGGEDAEKYLYKDGEANPLKRVVDNLIENGIIQPSIIVTPSWNLNNVPNREYPGREQTDNFKNEIVDLMKVVETKYSTYAASIDDEGFTSSREHRSVAGWSMGSVTTWCIMSQHVGYFKRFGNMSCDSWIACQDGGKLQPNETAELLTDAIKAQGYSRKDFESYIITGSKDATYAQVTLMVGCLMAFPEYFLFDGEEQNAIYLVWKDGEHHTQWRLQYTYNVIKNFLA